MLYHKSRTSFGILKSRGGAEDSPQVNKLTSRLKKAKALEKEPDQGEVVRTRSKIVVECQDIVPIRKHYPS
jgi:hypothetical protein